MGVLLIYEFIGTAIRQRRKKLGLTQEQLAKLMDTSRASLANIEIGRQNVLVHQLLNFAAALDMKIEDLLPPQPTFKQAASPSDFPLPDGLNRLQKQQISQLLSGSPEEAITPQKGKRNATQAKQ